MIKKIWFFFLIILSAIINITIITSAQNIWSTWDSPVLSGNLNSGEHLDCNDLFTLTGAQSWLVGYTNTYELLWNKKDFSAISEARFRIDWKIVENTGFTLQHTFTTTGSHTVWVQLTTPLCTWSSETQVSIFEKQILYIGNDTDFLNFWFEKELNKAGYLLTKNLTKKSDSIEAQDLSGLGSAETIIIHEKNFRSYLEKYIAIKKLSPTPLSKKIVIITDANKNLIKRSLSQYAQALESDQISIINPLHFLNFLSDLSLQKDYTQQGYTTEFNKTEDSGSKWMFVSFFVDKLLAGGFPLEMLGVLLSLTVVALIISFLRQIVGLSAYGVYWPLLFALTAHLLGLKITLILLLFAVITRLIMNGLNKTIYLLHNSKVSIWICVYLLVFLIGNFICSKLWIQIFEGRNMEILMITPLILMLIISEKIFPTFNLFQKKRRFSFFELTIVSALSYGILQRSRISTTLLSYPELLLVLLLINILVGRFLWLQLLELVRFMPLIRKYFEQEEE